MRHDVFLSYSSKEAAYAESLRNALEKEGLSCWFAPRDIAPGAPYAEAIVTAIPESQAVVLVLSSNSNQSPQVIREMDSALRHGIPILPVRIEDMQPDGSMLHYIGCVHWVDAFALPAVERDQIVARKIAAAVHREPAGEAPAQQVAATKPPPRERRRNLRLAYAVAVALTVLSAVAIVVHMADSESAPAPVLTGSAQSDVAVDAEPVPPGMVRILGGEFVMGSHAEELKRDLSWCQSLAGNCVADVYLREQPTRRVRVSSFAMEETEVPTATFVAWLNTRAGLAVRDYEVVDADGRVLAWTSRPGVPIQRDGVRFHSLVGWENRPVTLVTWHGAARYCDAVGKRLPTEAEWEFAAKGSARRRFPWGDQPPQCDRVAFGRAKGRPCAHLNHDPAQVGTSPLDVTPEGVRDLGANVAEWVQDAFQDRYRLTCDPVCEDPVVEPISGDGPVQRVVRGGYFDEWQESCRAAGRAKQVDSMVALNLGFRCVKSLKRKGEVPK